MKKWLPRVLVFMLGLCCGAGLTFYFTWSSSASLSKVHHLSDVATLEGFASEVCDAGDLDSCIVALNYLAGNLQSLTEARGHLYDDYESFVMDLGFTHGRLCLAYRAKGEDNLADHHYEETVRLIGSHGEIDSEDGLSRMIQRIDDGARKSR